MCSPRDGETRPVSGSEAPVSTSSRVVLPSPLRPTTPIRSPRADAERDVGEQRADAVRLRDPLEVDQVGHDATTSSTTWAPATGPLATSTPARLEASRRPPRGRASAARAQEHGGRPRAGHQTAQCAGALAAVLEQVAEVRPQVERGGLQVVVQRRRRATSRVARAPARRAPTSGIAGSSGASVGEPRRTRRTPPASTARRSTGTTHPPPASPASARRRQHLAATVPMRGAADQRERHVAARARRRAPAGRRRASAAPRAGRRATRAAAASADPPASPPATGMSLVDVRPRRLVDAVVLGEQPGGPDDDVGLVGGTSARPPRRRTRCAHVDHWPRRTAVTSS